MNRITINGKTITCSGSNVVINNGKVIVDGNTIQECSSDDIKVVIEGDVNKIDCGGLVEVHGNSGNINCGGSCEVSGDVKGADLRTVIIQLIENIYLNKKIF